MGVYALGKGLEGCFNHRRNLLHLRHAVHDAQPVAGLVIGQQGRRLPIVGVEAGGDDFTLVVRAANELMVAADVAGVGGLRQWVWSL